APHLPELRRQHPHLRINLVCGMTPADVMHLQAEVALQFDRPTAKDLKVAKLCRLHFMPFATQSYLDQHGRPDTIDDLARHQIVIQSSAQTTPVEQTPPAVQTALRANPPVLQTNASSALFMGVMSGLGIAMLPTYGMALNLPIVPLDIGFQTHHDL